MAQLDRNFNEALRGFQQDIVNLSRRIDHLEGKQNQETEDISAKLVEVEGRLGAFIRYQERHHGLSNVNDAEASQTLNNFQFKKDSDSDDSAQSTVTFNNDSTKTQYTETTARTTPDEQMTQRKSEAVENHTSRAQNLTNNKPPVNQFYDHTKSIYMVPMSLQQMHQQQQPKFPSDITVDLSKQLPVSSSTIIQHPTPQVPPSKIIMAQGPTQTTPMIINNSVPTPPETQQRASSNPPPPSQACTPVNKVQSPSQQKQLENLHQVQYNIAANHQEQQQHLPDSFRQTRLMNKHPVYNSLPEPSSLPFTLPITRPPEALDSEMDEEEIAYWSKIEFETLNPVPQSVNDVIEEWESGYRGQPPLKFMERHRKTWRKGNRNLSKKFCRRHRIIAAIEVGVVLYGKEYGLSYAEAKDKVITELEEMRTRDKRKKETMYWLFHNIPQHLKKHSFNDSGDDQ